MIIWLIEVGEPLPIDEGENRLWRYGLLSNFLFEAGHAVIWWTSSFDHILKKQRSTGNAVIKINPNYRIMLLHSMSYNKNISLRRIINHYGIAKQFRKLVNSEIKPDIILSAIPTIGLCDEAIKYGKKMGVPVVLDIQDLWPDIFLDIFPDWAQAFGRIILFPVFNKVKKICRSAFSIIGNTEFYVKWGIDNARRTQTRIDRDFPLGYERSVPDKKSIIKSEKFWQRFGLKKDKDFIACFIGTLGYQFDLRTVILAARKEELRKRNIKIVICGTGDNLKLFKDIAKGCDNIIFPGWINEAKIYSLLTISSVGLTPYYSTRNFVNNLPNKPIEYLSAGLPIVSSLKGVLENLLNKNKCGLTYQNNDINDFAEKLVYLSDNQDKLKQMSKNALRLYKKKFVAKKVYGEMISHLEKIVKEYNKDKN